MAGWMTFWLTVCHDGWMYGSMAGYLLFGWMITGCWVWMNALNMFMTPIQELALYKLLTNIGFHFQPSSARYG